MTFLTGSFEAHQQHTRKPSPFSIDISSSHMALNTGLRRNSRAAEMVKGSKALQDANMLYCFPYSQSKMVQGG